mmetsp:Transcript_22202/g.39998  ORF Transcript_22202/g.39998 Transcript_22202/m.39998 type:complete len:83 (-) Transcript_22202:234-482(-)
MCCLLQQSVPERALEMWSQKAMHTIGMNVEVDERRISGTLIELLIFLENQALVCPIYQTSEREQKRSLNKAKNESSLESLNN